VYDVKRKMNEYAVNFYDIDFPPEDISAFKYETNYIIDIYSPDEEKYPF
jgi:hypothetical protein